MKTLNILKWIAVASIGTMVLLYGADKLNVKDKKSERSTMLKNEWREFDVDGIVGETPSSLFGGLTKGPALNKYRLELRYPFDGKVGFYGGSNRREQEDLCFQNKQNMMSCSEKNEVAILFKTTDDGKTFTRQELAHGIAQEIKEMHGSYFLRIHEADTWADKTFRSDDFGKTWKHIGDFYIDAMLDEKRFIYVVVKSVSVGKRSRSYFYTKDGGKTSVPLSNKILAYHEEYKQYPIEVYKGRLAFLKKNSLVFIDIDTLEEEVHHFDTPSGKVIRNMQIDKRSGEPYIRLDKGSKPTRLSIYYPFTNVHVEFEKSQKDLDKEPIFLKVDGDYIGSLTRVNGALFHFWTLNKGKKWEMEVLEHYFFDDAFTGYGNGRIYMNAMIKTKDKKDRKSYFIMGKIRD